MSLQIWLPLNGSLKNQGVLSTPTPSSSVTFSNEGKMFENCLKSGTKAIYNVNSGNISTRRMTVSFWGKADNYTGTGTQWWQVCSFNCNDGTKFHIYCVPNVRYKMEYDPELNVYCDTNIWHHVTYVIDGTKITAYIDGNQSATITDTNVDRTLTSISIGVSTVKINDFRVYNHCSSPREIKKISQGLILHMPLKGTEISPTTNLATYPTPGRNITNSYDWDASLHADAISVTGWGVGYNGGVENPTEGYHAHWQLIDGLPTMVFPNLNSEINMKKRWLGISGSTGIQTKIGASKTYTVSFDAKASASNMVLSSGLYYRITGGTGNAFHDALASFEISETWARYSYTKTTRADINTSVGASFYFYGHNGNIEGIIYVRNIQVELNDYATAYTKDTRSSIIEDCSGNRYHGKGIGVLVTSKDAPRYSNCIYISDGRYNYGESGIFTMPKDQITISCWFKSSAIGYSSYHIPLSFGGANYEMSIDNAGHFRNGFSINGSRSVLTTSHTSILDGEWHMLTATYDGATIKRYLDGTELESYRTSITGTLAGGTSKLLIGNYNGTTYGAKEAYMSDVRVYAAALTAEDIKTLYNSSFQLLNDNTIVAYEYQENNNGIKFYKNGCLQIGGFLEDSAIKIFEDKIQAKEFYEI